MSLSTTHTNRMILLLMLICYSRTQKASVFLFCAFLRVFSHTTTRRARRKEFCLRLIHPKSKGKEECGPEILSLLLVKINIFRISQKGDEKKEKN